MHIKFVDAHNLEDETKGKSKAASDVEACGRILEILVQTWSELKNPARHTDKDTLKGSKWEEFQILAYDRLYKAQVPPNSLTCFLSSHPHAQIMADIACLLRRRRRSTHVPIMANAACQLRRRCSTHDPK